MSGNLNGSNNSNNKTPGTSSTSSKDISNNLTPPPIPPRPQLPLVSSTGALYHQPATNFATASTPPQPNYAFAYYYHPTGPGTPQSFVPTMSQQQSYVHHSAAAGLSGAATTTPATYRQQPATSYPTFYAPGNTLSYRNNNDVFRAFEYNSSSALKSVENIIRTLNAIVQMLETTLQGFYSTFQAIISVADHFIGLKRTLNRVLASLAALKFIRWIFRRFWSFSRFLSGNTTTTSMTSQEPGITSAANTTNAMVNEAWSSINNICEENNGSSVSSSIFNLAFAAVAVGGPILIYKVINGLISRMESSRKWATGENEHYVGVTLFEFNAGSLGELSFSANQKIRIAPKHLQPAVKGWLLASVDGNEIGLVPANYIKILNQSSGTRQEYRSKSGFASE